jgi:NTP pyrophosphatase (non-canonical NTP hydrolase)
MNKLQELMVITMEECGELTQVCSKTIRKFKTIKEIDDNILEKLTEETGDVLCMLQLMIKHNIISEDDIQKRADAKMKKLKKWSSLIE